MTEPGEFNNYVVQYWYTKSARRCELHRFQANVVSAVLVSQTSAGNCLENNNYQ